MGGGGGGAGIRCGYWSPSSARTRFLSSTSSYKKRSPYKNLLIVNPKSQAPVQSQLIFTGSPTIEVIQLHRQPISGIAEGIHNRHTINVFQKVKRGIFSAWFYSLLTSWVWVLVFNMVLKLRLMTTYTKHNENDIDIDNDNDVDILNSASRILQCWSYYVKVNSARHQHDTKRTQNIVGL